MQYQPIIIIGAGRSGTNIMRDTLSVLPGWTTWNCDEINLIWRHGNIGWPDDALPASAARPRVARYIRAAFDRLHKKSGASFVLEKTCANSLRVPFVDAILPEARYVHIVRDGRDVALSAARRWTAKVELGYVLKKLRYVPLSDVPFHGIRFVANRLHQMRSKEGRQAIWGPRFQGMHDYAARHRLIEICAKQWSRCVDASDEAFSSMPGDKVFFIRYEEFVADPPRTLERLGAWADYPILDRLPQDAIGRIRPDHASGWSKRTDDFTENALAEMAPVLERHGYAPTPEKATIQATTQTTANSGG